MSVFEVINPQWFSNVNKISKSKLFIALVIRKMYKFAYRQQQRVVYFDFHLMWFKWDFYRFQKHCVHGRLCVCVKASHIQFNSFSIHRCWSLVYQLIVYLYILYKHRIQCMHSLYNLSIQCCLLKCHSRIGCVMCIIANTIFAK